VVHADERIDGTRHAAALNHLIEQFRVMAERFRALRDALKPDSITIYGGLHEKPDEQCSIWLDSD